MEAPASQSGTGGMSTVVASTLPSEIETGIVYTVTWRDGTDARTVERFTPLQARRDGIDVSDPEHPPSWLMIGVRLRRFREWLERQPGGDPDALEFSPWRDLDDIADKFARVFGLPGRMGFDPAGLCGIQPTGREFGGTVAVVEADLSMGATVDVYPLTIGTGWIGLVARISPVERVLAIPSRAVAVVTANMLGSACRRTRAEALLFLCAHARYAYSSLAALLNLRRSSTGASHLEQQAAKLGELMGIEAAIPCESLYEFAEHGGKAAISIAANHDAVEPRSCGTLGDSTGFE